MLQRTSRPLTYRNKPLGQARNRRFGRGSTGTGAWLGIRVLEHGVVVLPVDGTPVQVEEVVEMEQEDLPTESKRCHSVQIQRCSLPEHLNRTTMQRHETFS